MSDEAIRPHKGPQTVFLSTPADVAVYGGAVGGGKAQPDDTSIITPFGLRQLGDLEVGDTISNPDGSPTDVIAVHPQGLQTVYMVSFDDGAETLATADHLWVVRRTQHSQKRKTPWRLWTTSMVSDWLENGPAREHIVIPLTKPVSFTTPSRWKRYRINPYILGALLGDGCLRQPDGITITSDRGEVVRVMRRKDVSIRWRKLRTGNGCTYRTESREMYQGLRRELERYGLMGKYSYEKHIPDEYMLAPLDVRMELIRGLFDTDGYADKRGHVQFVSTSEELALQVRALIWSFGGKATMTKKQGAYSDKDGRRIACRTAYMLYVQHQDAASLFCLKRKKERCSPGFNGCRAEIGRRVVSVVKQRKRQKCRCITVDNPNGLYLTNDFIVTHNSFALLLEACRHIARPGYSAIIFRRTYPSIRGPGSLFELSRDLYSRPGMEGVATESPSLLWTFPTGSMIQFSHLQHEKNALDHRGREYAFIGWDELTEFTETQFWELFSRNRTTCGIRPYMRATCNPDPDHFVRRMLDWWIDDEGYPIPERSGKLRWFLRRGDDIEWFEHHVPSSVSLTFIPARLADNPTLTAKDPDYQAKLETLPRVERIRLLGGNWNIRPAGGQYFKRHYFEVIDAAPTDVRDSVRAWDLAATKPSESNRDPDWTVGVKLSKLRDGSLCIEHAERLRESPLGVERALCNTAAQDGPKTRIGLWADPGQAGKSQAQHLVKLLSGYRVKVERATKDKVTYAGPVSSQAEAGNIKLVRGVWNEPFLRTLESFPDGAHDDDVDALSLAHLLCAQSNLEALRRLATR